MNTDAMRETLSQTVAVSGCGLMLLAIGIVVAMRFITAAPPPPAPDDTIADEIHRGTSNFMRILLMLAAVIVALALFGEAIGIDTLQGVTPR